MVACMVSSMIARAKERKAGPKMKLETVVFLLCMFTSTYNIFRPSQFLEKFLGILEWSNSQK